MRLGLPTWLRTDTVMGRSALLLLAVVIISQTLTALASGFFIVRPQTERIANMLAQSISAVAFTLDRLPPDAQAALLAQMSASPNLQFHEDGEAPKGPSARPTILELFFMEALQRQLQGRTGFAWKTDETGRIWVSMTMAGRRYWISAEPPKDLRPDLAFLLSAGMAGLLLTGFAVLLQRRISAPLNALSQAAATVSLTHVPEPIYVKAPLEVQALAESFNRMTARIAAAEAERAEMLAGLSHDLRTPLAKIRLAAELIPATHADLSALIARQIETMDGMLGQFLDFARGIDNEPVEELELTGFVEGLLLGHAEAPVAFHAAGPLTIRVRKDSLARAIVNLLRNAVRHGQAPFAIAVDATPEGAVISVCDRGPGIPDAEWSHVTQPFVRGDKARGGAPGTGLGLAIAARVAKAHGGSLTCSSDPARGFCVSLEIAHPTHGALDENTGKIKELVRT